MRTILVTLLTLSITVSAAHARSYPQTQTWKKHMVTAKSECASMRQCIAKYHKPVKRTKQILTLVHRTAQSLKKLDKTLRVTITALTALKNAPKIGPAVTKVVIALKKIHGPIQTASAKMSQLDARLKPVRNVVGKTSKAMKLAIQYLKRAEKVLAVTHKTVQQVERCLRSMSASQQNTWGPKLERTARTQNTLYPHFHNAAVYLQKPCHISFFNPASFINVFNPLDNIAGSLGKLEGYFKKLDPFTSKINQTLNIRVIVPPGLVAIGNVSNLPHSAQRRIRMFQAGINGYNSKIRRKYREIKKMGRMIGSKRFVKRCILRPSKCLKIYSVKKLRSCVRKFGRCKRRLRSKIKNRYKDINQYRGQISNLQRAIQQTIRQYSVVYTIGQIIRGVDKQSQKVKDYLKKQAEKVLGKYMSYLQLPVPQLPGLQQLRAMYNIKTNIINGHVTGLNKLTNLNAHFTYINRFALNTRINLSSITKICSAKPQPNRQPVALLYEHYNFKGRVYKLYKNTPALTGWWNDKISSIRILRGRILLYEHYNY
ncbi:MAG TPA: hypothetical protein DCE42_22625, partial [Myxococcales bacterium]|nr:hypothetical protein [Myxococcales bacterium]